MSRAPRLSARDYQGLTALITGASSGIGRELALRFAQQGAQVGLVARRGQELDALASEITDAGGRALALPCDVSVRAQVDEAAAHVSAELGEVDLLVNNAGYGHHRPFLDWDVADMEQMLRVNLLGSIYWTKAVLPAMVSRRRGWLVFMASVAGRIAPPDESAYVASKFAMVGLAESLSIELEESGVHVLTVCPGTIRTPFFDEEALRRMPPVAKRSMVAAEPLVDAIMLALSRGKRDLTYPRAIALAYAVRALLPGLFRLGVKRTTSSVRKRREPSASDR